MTEREQAIKEVAEARRLLESAEAKLKAEEVTYSIGDRFKYCGKQKLILSQISGKVGFVELDTGRNWGHNYKQNVVDIHEITKAEMGGIWNQSSCKRYWDNRKQVKV